MERKDPYYYESHAHMDWTDSKSSELNRDRDYRADSETYHDEAGGGRSRDRRLSQEDRSHSSGKDRYHSSTTSSRRHDRRSRSRSRSKSRDRGHSKKRKERKRRRRSSSKSRSRSDSRSCSRSRRRRRHHRTDSKHSTDDEYSDSYGCGGGNRTQYDSYKFQEPNSTIMVRGLASHLTENDIRQEVLKCGIMVKDVRLIRNRDTGASRGFAFVEFNSVAEATRWMEMKNGIIVLQDQFQANLIYSIAKLQTGESNKVAADWFCDKCQGHNFKRREVCYKCNTPRPEDGPDTELLEEISMYPTTTILLSNLDALTTEEGVLQSFQTRASMAMIPIRNVRIGRDPGSCLSRGVCYVEANNVAEASHLFTVLIDDPLVIDGRTVVTSYAKIQNNPATLLKNSNAAAAAVAAAQWTNGGAQPPSGPPCTQIATVEDVEKMAEYSSNLYAKTAQEYASYLDYYRNYYRQQLPGKGADPVKSGPSYQSADGVAALGSLSQAPGWPDKPQTGSHPGPPDTSGYQYDEASGYYYDSASGFYYDATTSRWYDPEKQLFLIWCTHSGKLIPAPEDDKSDANEAKEKKGDKKTKVTIAKKTVKEMEKWAKTLNQKKDGYRPEKVPEVEPTSAPARSSRAPSSSTSKVRSEPQFVYTAAENAYQPPPKVTKSVDKEDSSSDDDKALNVNLLEASLVDEEKMACLLCKRLFSSKDVLQKHVKMSALHKQNLEALRKGQRSGGDGVEYRDRAKERRETNSYGQGHSSKTRKH